MIIVVSQLYLNDFKSASILDDSLLLKLTFISVRPLFYNTDSELVHLSRGSNDCLFAAAS